MAACLLLVSFLAPLIATYSIFAAERRVIIHGQSQRPFPALFALDYPLARAEAWLGALNDASRFVPASFRQRFLQAGFDPQLAMLALCALAFPLDVITPDKRPDSAIRVFLQKPPNLESLLAYLTSMPDIIAKEMAIIAETASITAKARKAWPDSVDSARTRMTNLETLAITLESLWNATEILKNSVAGDPTDWRENTDSNAESAIILLESARETGDIFLAEKAVKLLLDEEAAQLTAPKSSHWSNLVADGLFLRGLAHKKMQQYALAETDFSSALARLAKTGIRDGLARTILHERADLRKSRDNIAGMCEDFKTACALGDCLELSRSRQEGKCLETP